MKNLVHAALLLAGCFLSSGVKAQFEKDYTPIRSGGTIPAEFLKNARQTSIEEINKLGYGVTDRTAKTNFIIENNYFLSQLLLGGDVLINDPLTIYVNKVADELLKDQPEIRSQLHIYVTESPYVNAYAYDKGYIFVNLGLLAQLENEAQLAYVLSHEITHIIKKHSINQYLENIRLDNGTSNYERGSSEMRYLAKYRYSKDNESAADIEGLAMLKKTKYSIKAVNGAFDVMQYSYLPFELPEFNKSFFEDGYLVIPDTLVLKKTQEIKADDDYDDSKSTHPNIKKRRSAIEGDLKVSDEASRKKYLVSEEDFKLTRERARFEMCRLYILEKDYINAIYSAYILLQKYPDNLYLKKNVAKALYCIQINKSSGDRNQRAYRNMGRNAGSLSGRRYSIPNYEKIEGASQRLYYMLDNMSSRELNTVALSYTFRAHKQFPDDPILSGLTDSLFSEMVNVNNLMLSDFSEKTLAELMKADTTASASVDSVKEEVEESKYSTIKKQQKALEMSKPDENFEKYAFVGLLKDPEFQQHFRAAAHGLSGHQTVEPAPSMTPQQEKEQADKKAEAHRNSQYLGIEKIIFLDPYYQKVHQGNGENGIDYYASEDKQKELLEVQKKCADMLHLKYEVLSNKDLTENDIDKYNENAIMNAWLTERFNFGDNPDALVLSTEESSNLIRHYGSRYVAWSGIYNYNSKKTTYFFIVFDLETGELMKFDTRYIHAKDNHDLINSFVYNSIAYVAKKPK